MSHWHDGRLAHDTFRVSQPLNLGAENHRLILEGCLTNRVSALSVTRSLSGSYLKTGETNSRLVGLPA